MKSYVVMRLARPITIDARWKKYPWAEIPHLSLNHHMGDMPEHYPVVRVKLAYDQDGLYAIFKVEDRYVCARKHVYQERVCEDSCVEFFFTPCEDINNGYFNLEVNCGGTVFFQHQLGRHIVDKPVSVPDFNQLIIAHSLPKIVDPEITESITWVVEYCLPFAILANYAPLIQPSSGVTWRVNFYKCADACSYPHWLTWSPVDLPTPDFHRPEFFGDLIFG
jgi:hypothetical protein